MSWRGLFEHAPADVTVGEIRDALADHRATKRPTDETSDESTVSEPPDPSPTRVVADADVLAADCCLDGPSRAVLDDLYRHSWTTLIASDRLLDDAETVIETVATPSLARKWREQITVWRQPISHPAGDHPALGSAYRGGAMQLLSFDDALTSSAAGASLNNRVPISVRQPDAFRLLFDAESLYESAFDGAYPGPDREPRN